ncbi:MAG: Arc family DNA-binding protein [Terriglobales bacterium]|jgi:plasmid stability protein
MAQFVVRNVEGSVKLRLQRRARRNGHSMEEEVRDILRDAVKDESSQVGGLGSEISALFSSAGLGANIPELRGYEVDLVDFEK